MSAVSVPDYRSTVKRSPTKAWSGHRVLGSEVPRPVSTTLASFAMGVYPFRLDILAPRWRDDNTLLAWLASL